VIKRLLMFVYGVACYAVFFATFLYAVGFIGGFLVPRSIDSPANGPLGQSIAIDLGLLSLFALQHSGMARPAFKRWLTRCLSPTIERSTYVLLSSVALIVLFVFWQPLGGVVWDVTDPFGRAVLYALFAFGWLLVLVATFLINHFDLFGLRQVWLALIGKPYVPIGFRTPGPYRLVRHPLYVGWFFAFWATPLMTTAHLLFAIVTTAYILVAIRWEERDLVDSLGDEYREYRRRVPMIIPGRKAAARASAAAVMGTTSRHGS
jgi:protein-S-isoprenylcysteine O-methyltransferase Ste14